MIQSATHFLFPSTLFASREPSVVNTILGSCVAVCLYDPVTGTGGINHYMLPLWDGNGLASPKFGNIAIHRLLELMLRSGCNQKHIVAKVFGGGSLIEQGNAQFMIGERNIMVAQALLKELQIDIVSSSVGGTFGRKIQFNTATGEVKQMLIHKH